MEFKLVNINTGEEIMTGESVNLNELERKNQENIKKYNESKRYKVVIKTQEGEEYTRYTNYIDRDDAKKELYIEGLVFKEVDLVDIDEKFI